MMAFPHHKKSEGTTATTSSEDKMKASKKKCFFKNYGIDNSCTKTKCLLYPKLNCRKFTYTNNAHKDVPRCEHLLNQTRYCPTSDLRCNPFQTPLKEIVAQDIRSCVDERCSNYSLRYIFKNFFKCDMDALKGLLPSYRGYDNICCKRPNYSRTLADKIDDEKLQMFQVKLAEAVKETRRSHAANPYGIQGSSFVHRKCNSLPSYQVQLSKDPSPPAETNYLFRSQLMELAKRKFEENKDLVTGTNKNAVAEINKANMNAKAKMNAVANKMNAVEFQNTDMITHLDDSNIEKLMDEETLYKPEYIPPVFDIYEADGTPSLTIPGTGLAMSTTADTEETGELALNDDNLLEALQVMADELNAAVGDEVEITSSVQKFGNDDEPDFTVDIE